MNKCITYMNVALRKNKESENFHDNSGSVSDPGSRRAKMTHKNRKNLDILCFEVLDVLLLEL
jgi:hypothetical protein